MELVLGSYEYMNTQSNLFFCAFVVSRRSTKLQFMTQLPLSARVGLRANTFLNSISTFVAANG
jgi:hypothetical protein